MTKVVRKRLVGLSAVALMLAACGSESSSNQDPWQLRELEDPEPVKEDMAPDLNVPDEGPVVPIQEGELTGAACSQGDACWGGECLNGGQWPAGYCSQAAGCDTQSCGEQGGRCAAFPGEDICVRACSSARECRDGYTCQLVPDGSFTACLASDPIPEGAADGEACAQDSDCAGGTCIPDAEGWPQGYCTSIGCRTREDCASPGGEDNRCYRNPQGPSLCVRICTAQDQCRDGYNCQPVDNQGNGFCVPGDAPADIEITEDFTTYPFAISCERPAGSSVSLPFTVAADSSSYMFTPFARDMQQLRPQRITAPNQLVDFSTQEHYFQTATSQFFGFINPTLMPGAPQFAATLEAGAHTYGLRTSSADLCSYLLEEKTAGTTIDLNIYLVGVDGIDAASAPLNNDMQMMLAAFNGIYVQAGIEVGTVKYFDITGEAAQRYAVIRSDAAASELPTLSKLQGSTYDDALSLNIFFVREFAMQGGAIGVSLGLPGPAGLHGTPASGVVFTSEFLGQTFRDGSSPQPINGNQYTGIVMAHEVGHYLGLFHTSETSGQVIEPLADTPSCSRQNFPNNCPDINNLMFPLAGITHTEVSADQSFVIKSNPLTKD